MDFPTDHYVWLAQAKRGAKLDVVRSSNGIDIEPEQLIERIDEDTMIVNTNRVLFESSRIVDIAPVISKAHEMGALLLTDDFHGSGMVPIDVHELNVDFLFSGCLKWLCGGQGLAFMYVRRDLIQQLEPTTVGWFGTKNPFDFDRSGLNLRDDARRFEAGTYTLPQAWTAYGGLSIILEVGVDRIRARNQELTRMIIAEADTAGLEVLTPRDDESRGGLVRVRVPGGRPKAEEVLHTLFAQNVVLDQRGDALRISPHFFSTEEDIETCFRHLRAVLEH
jgi:kynureninase